MCTRVCAHTLLLFFFFVERRVYFRIIRPCSPDGNSEKITSTFWPQFFLSEIGELGHLVQLLGKHRRPVTAVVFSGAQINKRQIINSVENYPGKAQHSRNGNFQVIPPHCVGVKHKQKSPFKRRDVTSSSLRWVLDFFLFQSSFFMVYK